MSDRNPLSPQVTYTHYFSPSFIIMPLLRGMLVMCIIMHVII